MRTLSGRIQGLERVGGFKGIAVALAEGMLYADNPDFNRQELHKLAAVTPQQVRAAMQRWLTRPVYALRVDPGAREPYVEAPAAPAVETAPSPAESLRTIPRQMPPVAEASKLDFPTIERARLSNGIELVYAHRSAVPVTYVAAEFDAGAAADPANRLGTQALMLNLLDEGTTSLNSIQLAEAQERLGANISTGASVDRTTVSLTALSTSIDPSLALLADVIRNPAFAPSEVERAAPPAACFDCFELTQPAAIARRMLWFALSERPTLMAAFVAAGTTNVVETLTRDELIAFITPGSAPTVTIFVASDLPLDRVTAAFGGAGRLAPARQRGGQSNSTSVRRPHGRVSCWWTGRNRRSPLCSPARCCLPKARTIS
jgi:predicted Zn-dependent peptidase